MEDWHEATTWPVGDAEQFHAVVDGRLYVFQHAEARDLFLGVLTEESQNGHAIDASLSLEDRVAAGDARWATWQGDRTLFATDCFGCACNCVCSSGPAGGS